MAGISKADRLKKKAEIDKRNRVVITEITRIVNHNIKLENTGAPEVSEFVVGHVLYAREVLSAAIMENRRGGKDNGQAEK